MSTETNTEKSLANGTLNGHPAISRLNDNSQSHDRAADLEANLGGIKPAYQPIPPYPARGAVNPAPLGLIGFACSIFLLSVFDLEPRGIKHPDVMIGNLVFFGGLAQFVSGVGEFILGNTFPGTVFCSYAAFNFALAMIRIPGTGIALAYLDPETHKLLPEFDQALAIFLWSWFIVSVIFTIGALRTTAVFVALFVFADLTLMFMACHFMVGGDALGIAGNVFGLIATFLALYAGTSILWSSAQNGINLPMWPLMKQKGC